MIHPAIAHIDLEALHSNLHKIKEITPKSNILAMVKRDAYGHGAVEVAKSLEHYVDAFGVALLKEALQLQESGIKKPIVILAGFFNAEELHVIDDFGFECIVHNFEQIEILEKSQLSKPIRIWFKIDTGMHRLGFQPHQVQEAYKKLMQNKMVQKPFRLMTHFSDANDLQKDKTSRQIELFEQIVTDLKLEGEWCVANSSAILKWPKAHTSWVRPGIALYGVSPLDDATVELKPVMTLTSRIMAIHDLEKGAAIGYGGEFICPESMRVGIASIGYGDGYPRNAKSGTPVLVNGICTQLIGCVAMDIIGIDLRLIPNAKIGDSVILWGHGLPVEKIEASTGENRYELISRLTSRVHHQFYKKLNPKEDI